MRVNGKIFVGAMATILMSAGVANAVPQIASKQYVDNNLAKKVDATTVGDLAGVSSALGTDGTIAAAIAAAATATDVSGLATKEEVAAVDNKIGDTSGLVTETNTAGTIVGALAETKAAVAQNASDISTLATTVGDETGGLVKEVADLKTNTSNVAGLATTVEQHTTDISGLDTRVTAAEGEIDTLQTDLNTVSGVANTAAGNAVQALNDIGAKANLTTTEKGSLVGAINEIKAGQVANDALAGDVSNLTTTVGQNTQNINTLTQTVGEKANSADVYLKTETYNQTEINTKFDNTIPQPEGACAAESGRCVLSVDAVNKKFIWMDVTAPLDEPGAGNS